jgi:chromosome segregation ATPase
MEQMLFRLLEHLGFLRGEVAALQEKNLELIRQNEESSFKEKTSKLTYETLQKDHHFLTEHLKRLSKEKMQCDKKIQQLNSTIEELKTKVKHYEGKKGGREDALHRTQGQERDGSLDINEFIQMSITRLQTEPDKSKFNRTNLTRKGRH